MKRISYILAAAVLSAALPAYAEVANIKVVTDASPDYTDMESMVRSITSKWDNDADKMWALFYSTHIGRRQTNPIMIHGFALTDPIRQFNDYGYTMCSTISGVKTSTWNYMGYPCRYFDIGSHTVCDVWYDGRFHHYDNSLSICYTLPDGKTIASVEDIGKMGSGPETDGKEIPGYIGRFHALNGTGPDGYIEGADTERSLKHVAVDCFNPKYLKYRSYLYDQDRGHRYILNLREGEVYTRYYSRQDAQSPNAVSQDDKDSSKYKADPAYFVPNGGKDPEFANPRYKIRGNGERIFTPVLDAAHLADALYSSSNIKAGAPGLVLVDNTKPGEAIFKVEGSNVITSIKLHALASGNTSIALSTNNGIAWKDLWKADKTGENTADLKLINEVNGTYDALVKLTLDPGASLKDISFNTITEVNAKTQPQLRLGKNTVYVGTGEQTESIVIWPEMQKGNYKTYLSEENNIAVSENNGYQGTVHPKDGGEGSLVFKVDSPTDMTSVTYGGRLYNRGKNCHIDFLHSFDGGKTWKQDYSLTDTKAPWDVVHYETVTDIPAGTKSVLFKYSMTSPGEKGASGACSIYTTRMEVNHKLAAPSNQPMEVTFNWAERQADYSTIKRSHTQLVDKLPATYEINVGGADHPIVESLAINLKGARPDVKYGYSDGKDVGGEKFVGVWATYGKNLAQGKPYTVSVPPEPKEKAWGANDDSGKRLTDGFVGSTYNGGVNFADGAMFKKETEIIVDLGGPQKCAGFRLHMYGYPPYDAIKGQVKDKVEVLTSTDGTQFTSAGFFDFNLHWKDIPENFMWNDQETFEAFNFTYPLKTPVEAHYVKYKLTPTRGVGISEVQVLDGYDFKPFDLKVAMPDPASNGKAAPNATISTSPRKWAADEKMPKTIGKAWKAGEGSGE